MTELESMKAAEEYNTGQFSIHTLAAMHGVSDGKMYYALRGLGCAFTRKWRKQLSEESRARMSKAQKGKVISEEQRKQISERNSCNYNGLNGYGHIKNIAGGTFLRMRQSTQMRTKTGM